MGINAAFVGELVARILAATEGGVKLNIHSVDDIGQYVMAIASLGLGLIPVIGTPLAALCNLLGAVLLHPDSVESIWAALSERIEQLIDAKIETYHLDTLKSKIIGFQDNLTAYSRTLKAYSKSNQPSEKSKAASALTSVHSGFLAVLRAGIPEFQMEAFAVPSLPLFSLVATMYLSLLVDGIQRGTEWGYAEENIEAFREEFRVKTTPQPQRLGGTLRFQRPSNSTRHYALPSNYLLTDAIQDCIDVGVSTAVIDSWKEAHSALSKSARSAVQGNEQLDYVTYANTTYLNGRQKVKLIHGEDFQGFSSSRVSKALSDYDTSMILSVLQYAEIWPFLDGRNLTEDALRNLGREIFYGPYGRWNHGASWSESSLPPVTDPSENITGVSLRAYNDVDGVRVRHGLEWDGFQGSSDGGIQKDLALERDEYITSVNVTHGFKLGHLGFTTCKGNRMDNGNSVHATEAVTVAPPGYMLSSLRITLYEQTDPRGCEGVILGFRPLFIDAN